MDFIMDWEIIKQLSNEEIIDIFNDATGFDLYSCSLDWRESKNYILKITGSSGDVIVNWL